MNVFDLAARITLDTTDYLNGLGKLAKVGGAALGAAGVAIGAFAKSAVTTGQEFDKSISQVAATMGLTMDEMAQKVGSVDLAWGTFSGNLREYAQEMGEHTAFSAKEASDALNYMALAGYDVQTSMEMLPNVLNLAAAGNMDLATASDMVTDTQTAFGISLERTSQMVDEMAKAASTGNTSVEQLGDAFLTVGGLAQELNGGFVTLADGTQAPVDGVQELEIALTAMANAGVKGSEAGTHMRNMLLKLSSPTDEGTKRLEAMGVAVFDTEGKMRSLSDIFGDLNGALSTMTQEEKIQAISELFNTRDLASAEALLNAVGQDWDKIGESILDAQGAAQQMADTQLDNLAGDITLFKSALEGAKIAVSDTLTPALRKFVQFGTESISELTTAFKEDGVDGAMEAFGTILSEGVNMIVEGAPQFLKSASKLVMSLVRGLRESIPTIINAAKKIVGDLAHAFVEFAPELLSGGMELLTQLAIGFVDSLPELVDAAVEVIGNLGKAIGDHAPELVDAGVRLFAGLVSNIPAIVGGIIGAIPDIVGGVVTALGEQFGKLSVLFDEEAMLIAQHGEAYQEAYDLAGLTENQQALVDRLMEEADALYAVDEAREAAFDSAEQETKQNEELWESLKAVTDEHGNVIEGKDEEARILVDKLNEALGTELEYVDGQVVGYEGVAKNIQEVIRQKELLAKANYYIEKETQLQKDLEGAEADLATIRRQRIDQDHLIEEAEAEVVRRQAELNKAEEEFGEYGMTSNAIVKQKQDALAEAMGTLQGYQDGMEELDTAYEETAKVVTQYSVDFENAQAVVSAAASGSADEIEDALNRADARVMTSEGHTEEQLARMARAFGEEYKSAKEAVDRYGDEQSQTAEKHAKEQVDRQLTELGKLNPALEEELREEYGLVDTQATKIVKPAEKGAQDYVNTTARELREGRGDIAGAVDTATSGMKNLQDKTGGWATSAMNNFIAGFTNSENRLFKAVGGVLERAVYSQAHHSVPEKGPLKDELKWMPDMMKNLAKGIRDNTYLVQDAMSGALDFTDIEAPELSAGGGRAQGYVQNVNIYSPKALTPYEVARQTRNATQSIALQLRGVR